MWLLRRKERQCGCYDANQDSVVVAAEAKTVWCCNGKKESVGTLSSRATLSSRGVVVL